jgi:hypothetical protein
MIGALERLRSGSGNAVDPAWRAAVIESAALCSRGAAELVERIRSTDVGHLENEVTIEDPSVLRRPWTQKHIFNLDPKKDLEEVVCTENNKDLEHMR